MALRVGVRIEASGGGNWPWCRFRDSRVASVGVVAKIERSIAATEACSSVWGYLPMFMDWLGDW